MKILLQNVALNNLLCMRKLVLIFIAFCLSFILMVTLSLFSIGRFSTFTDYSGSVLHTNRVIQVLYKTEVFLKDMDRWERGFILSNDSVYSRVVKRAQDSLYPSLYKLERLVADNPEQLANATELKGLIALRTNYARLNMHFVDSTHSRVASPYYFEGRKYMISANRKLRTMHEEEEKLLEERYKNMQFYQNLTISTIKTLLLIFCIITLFLFVMLIKVMRDSLRYQEALSAKVNDLTRSHNELQDITYAVSHDLQEPLRKIQVFSNMLLFKMGDDDDGDCKDTLERINTSAGKMQSLIVDLSNLTNLTLTDDIKRPVDLSRLVHHILIDIDDEVSERRATISAESLPGIWGYSAQLKILFKAILDNALKFSREGVNPEIKITSSIENGQVLNDINPALKNRRYYCISITDNGIGFDNRYIANIFKIFRRLHGEDSEYEGKGIGLAICQRVMANHDGYILAEGTPNIGATFKLYFPV